MSYTRLLLDRAGSVATVTLNRPDVHNAFDEILIAELTEVYTRLNADPGVRAIVLQGAGTSFCAGADLHWMARMADYTPEENRADARALQQMLAAIAHSPKVTLARVQGVAMGGGVGLVAVCDLAIAAPEAHFALSEVRLGLVPAIIGPYVLEKVGLGTARALFVTGERFTAEEARRIGLVQQVVPIEELDAALQRNISLVLQAGPEAIATAKRLLRTLANRTPDDAAEETIACIAALRVGAEGQEGIRAFLEKRKPGFAEER
jgi:methylglutaconyl-CoA hydratase